MSEKYVNHVNLATGKDVLDLRLDTVTEETMFDTVTAHNSEGRPITGTFPIGEVDTQSALISQIKSALADKVAVGGLFLGNGLVDVVNILPIIGIDENALYRVIYETNCYLKIGADVLPFEEMLIRSGNSAMVQYYEVDELPIEMMKSDFETEVHIYIVRDSGIAYFNLSDEIQTVGQWGFGEGFDKGATEDVYSETATGVYTILQSDVTRYFIREDGEWKEITAGGGTSSEKEEQEVNFPTITENGSYEILPDSGKVMSKATVEVAVPERYDEGYSAGKSDGYDEGYQKGVTDTEPNLVTLNATENKEYVPEGDVDGYSYVNVNVPLKYDEGYSEGFTEGKSEGYNEGYQASQDSIVLQEKSVDVTGNGTTEVTPDDGKYLSKVNVNVEVPDRYNEGYQKGIEDSEPILALLEVNGNGIYEATDGIDGYFKVVVDVSPEIPDDYIKPSGTKEITTNGTHDVTQYASVYVNVPTEGGGGDDSEVESYVGLIENKTTDFASDRITELSQYAFAYRTSLKNVSLPNLKSSNTRAFTNCDSLVSLSVPNMTGYTYQYMCAYCGALTTVDIKQAKYVSSYSFQSCTSLTKLEFNQVTTIATNAFNGCSKLTTLILRSPSVVTLSGTSAFTGTKIAGTGGYIYVPSALIEDYKAASNWSTYASKFRAIEDYPDITGGA